MRWTDLLRMSKNNLVRRKLRTILTVLGVVIGTASIVVMVSLGLGLQQSVYQMAEESGGLTSINVTAAEQMDSQSSNDQTKKYITDDFIQQLKELDHVKSANPVLTVSAILTKGKYESYVELTGMKKEAMKEQNIPLAWGTFPREKAGFQILPGNMIVSSFMVKGMEMSYGMMDDSSSEPAVDFTKDHLFLSFQGTEGTDGSSGSEEGDASPIVQEPVAKKYVVAASGQIKGDADEWNNYSYSIYVDMDVLLKNLKQQSKGGVIPGQPTTKTGKPYPYLTYTSAVIQADQSDNVKELMTQIKDMGYEVSSNMEMIESSQKQFAIIQGVLGAIGAVSLLVAAIGIANTMMMSIYERTKEIGVIKVLGCDMKNIKQMFLTEAAFIGFIGGVVGNVLSFLISVAINQLASGIGSSMGISGGISHIPLWLVLLSMGFSVFIGMAAGYFPALRAMKLSPLAAMGT